MEKFEIYISEIKTLKVKSIGRFIDLDHYTSIQSGYPAVLDILQKHALSDLRMLSVEKIQWPFNVTSSAGRFILLVR